MAPSIPNSQIPTPPKLLDRLRAKTRLLHYSIRTEEAYVGWCNKFILFHDKRHPNEMGGAEIERFLTHLATERKVAASTPNQVLAALLFLDRRVREREIGRLDAVRARRPVRVPLVRWHGERRQLLQAIEALPAEKPYGPMARLMDGARLPLMESCLRCR